MTATPPVKPQLSPANITMSVQECAHLCRNKWPPQGVGCTTEAASLSPVLPRHMLHDDGPDLDWQVCGRRVWDDTYRSVTDLQRDSIMSATLHIRPAVIMSEVNTALCNVTLSCIFCMHTLLRADTYSTELLIAPLLECYPRCHISDVSAGCQPL